MEVVIKNISDLKLEIARLQGVTQQQEQVIKQHFNSPRAILGTVTSLFSKPKQGDASTAAFDFSKYDITSLISKYILPLTLNKTLFRKSNFIVKALVALASRKVAGLVDDKKAGTLWDKVKGILPDKLVDKISPKKKKPLLRLPAPKKAIV